jgi:hypothetical protein
MYDSNIVLLAPGTLRNDEIALVPPPLDTYVILYLDSWIFLIRFILSSI